MVMLPVAIWAKLVTALSAGYLKGQSYQWLKWPVMKVIVTWEVSPHSLTGIWLNLLWLRHSLKWRPVLQDNRLWSSWSFFFIKNPNCGHTHFERMIVESEESWRTRTVFFLNLDALLERRKMKKIEPSMELQKKLARFENAGKPDSSQTNFKATLSL